MSGPDAVPVHRDDELASEREREDRGPSIIKIGWASPVACKNVLPSASNLFGNVLFRDRSRIRVNGGSWPLSVSATGGAHHGHSRGMPPHWARSIELEDLELVE
jgi:hypothetical protein